MKKYYTLIRALHLYFGLLISPFILIFSASVLFLNHSDYFNKLMPGKTLAPVQKHINNFIPLSSDSLTAKSILTQLDINGEIDWISKNDSTFAFPVNKPGMNKWISLNTRTGMAKINSYDEGIFKGMSYLHTMPGQHNAMMRGNSFFMKIWRTTTDVFVYVILFVSVTGVLLWYLLRPERVLGFFSFGLGFIFLIILLILLF